LNIQEVKVPKVILTLQKILSNPGKIPHYQNYFKPKAKTKKETISNLSDSSLVKASSKSSVKQTEDNLSNSQSSVFSDLTKSTRMNISIESEFDLVITKSTFCYSSKSFFILRSLELTLDVSFNLMGVFFKYNRWAFLFVFPWLSKYWNNPQNLIPFKNLDSNLFDLFEILF
jgi:hypothetical protein